MEVLGINIPGVIVKHEFIELMVNAGIHFVSLHDLLLVCQGIALHPTLKVMTAHKTDPSWIDWRDEHNLALSLVPPEVRYDYVLEEIRSHQQTQLSSIEHLV